MSSTSADMSPLDAKIISSSTRVYGDSSNQESSSVFSYDLRQKTNSTLPSDADFTPVDANIPVDTERRLTQTHHKDDVAAAISSGPGVARTTEDDNSIPPEQAVAKRRDSVLAATAGGADGLTSGPGSEPRRKPSRKPTGSYGVAPMTEDTGASESSGLFFSGGLPDTTSSGH